MKGSVLRNSHSGMGGTTGTAGTGAGSGSRLKAGSGPRCGIGFGLRFRGEHRNVGLASGVRERPPAGGRVRDVHALGVGRVPDLLDVLGVVLV